MIRAFSPSWSRASFAQYESFVAYLLERKPYLDPFLTFRQLCLELGLPHRRLNNTLLVELGLGGQEIMEIFREGDVKKLLFLQF